MKLIVGFGNPGNQYNFTRHNFGFLALDFYFKIHNLTWEPHQKHNAIWLKTTSSNGESIIFIKPQTFYNDIGTSIRAFANFYKISSDDIIVICDDFNIPFGTLRFRQNGSAGGNNGLKSTISALGTEKFNRLRLGTGDDKLRHKLGDTDFVLGRFTEEERELLPAILKNISDKIDNLT